MKFYLLFPHFIWFWFWSTIIVMTIMIKDDNRLPFFIFSFHILICPQRKQMVEALLSLLFTAGCPGLSWQRLWNLTKSCSQRKQMGEPSPSHSGTPWFVAALQQLYEILLKKKISQLLRMLCLVTLFLIVPTKDCFQQCISLRLLVSDRVTYGVAHRCTIFLCHLDRHRHPNINIREIIWLVD